MSLVQFSMSTEELAETITRSSSREDVLELVKELDNRAASWDFTLALCEYFAELKFQQEAEEKEDAKGRC